MSKVLEQAGWLIVNAHFCMAHIFFVKYLVEHRVPLSMMGRACRSARSACFNVPLANGEHRISAYHDIAVAVSHFGLILSELEGV